MTFDLQAGRNMRQYDTVVRFVGFLAARAEALRESLLQIFLGYLKLDARLSSLQLDYLRLVRSEVCWIAWRLLGVLATPI